MTGMDSTQGLTQAREIAALTAERDHYKRESKLGATMLGVIVSGLGLAEKATTKAGASVSDVLDHVAALTAEVDRLRIAHARADGALADATTVPTGDLERGIRELTAERDGLKYTLEAWAKAELDRLQHNCEAYRGALGYSVPGNHDGLLRDGTLPVNGVASALYVHVRAAEADVKALAEALTRLQSYCNDGGCWCDTRDFGLEDHTPPCLAARAALARDGVRRGRGEERG